MANVVNIHYLLDDIGEYLYDSPNGSKGKAKAAFEKLHKILYIPEEIRGHIQPVREKMCEDARKPAARDAAAAPEEDGVAPTARVLQRCPSGPLYY